MISVFIYVISFHCRYFWRAGRGTKKKPRRERNGKQKRRERKREGDEGDGADGGEKERMSGENDMTTETEVINRYRILQNEVQMLSSKSTELDQDRQEHELVLEALNGADDGRKCFRFMGGVLVERTVGEVRPAVTRYGFGC